VPRLRGRIPRVARFLALAHQFEELLDTHVVETQAEIAELAKLTSARVTQFMRLLAWLAIAKRNLAFERQPTPGSGTRMTTVALGVHCAEAAWICPRMSPK
jgi:hypothetical protein